MPILPHFRVATNDGDVSMSSDKQTDRQIDRTTPSRVEIPVRRTPNQACFPGFPAEPGDQDGRSRSCRIGAPCYSGPICTSHHGRTPQATAQDVSSILHVSCGRIISPCAKIMATERGREHDREEGARPRTPPPRPPLRPSVIHERECRRLPRHRKHRLRMERSPAELAADAMHDPLGVGGRIE
jgi:hypothetical protein